MKYDQKTIASLCETSEKFFTASDCQANIFTTTVADKPYTVVKARDDKETPKYFLLQKELGKGTFGQVSVGIELDLDSQKISENMPVAVKITDLSEQGRAGFASREEATRESLHEKSCLTILKSCFGYSIGKRVKEFSMEVDEGLIHRWKAEVEESVLIMPLYSGQTMDCHQTSNEYDILVLLDMSYYLSDNLVKLHAENIIHSDLKPANIIWDAKTREVNIVDFNRAKILAKSDFYSYCKVASDKEWMAPECSELTAAELLKSGCGYKYSRASDIYSLGAILTKNYGLDSANISYLTYDKILIKNFIADMKSPDEKSRPTAKACRKFFCQLKQQIALNKADPVKLFFMKTVSDLVIYAEKTKKLVDSRSDVQGLFASIGVIAKQNQKHELACRAISILNEALLAPELDKEYLVRLFKNCIESDENINGISSSSGELQAMFINLIAEIDPTASEYNNSILNYVTWGS
jgi:serine/threonine protein kinase